jgi:hypothetical protein
MHKHVVNSCSLNYIILFCVSFDAVLEDLGIDERIVLKHILKQYDGSMWTGIM